MKFMCGQISSVTSTSNAPAAAANRVASESNVSADPTWISVGGKPPKSANSGDISGFFRSTDLGTHASANSPR